MQHRALLVRVRFDRVYYYTMTTKGISKDTHIDYPASCSGPCWALGLVPSSGTRFPVYAWSDYGWVDGWMGGMGGWGWVDGCLAGWLDGWLAGWWVDGWMAVGVYDSTYARMQKCIHACVHLYVCVSIHIHDDPFLYMV